MSVKWGEISAAEISSAIQGKIVSGNKEAYIAGVSTDSREIEAGHLFFALKGENFNGHDFVEKAGEKGAAGIVIQKGFNPKMPLPGEAVVISVEETITALGDLTKWWRKSHNTKIAAITGSAGKTTTKELTAGILELGHKTLKNLGNFNNLIGLPLTLLKLDASFGRVVVEMGMNHPGEIARLTEIADPDVGVITNVAKAHLEGVGSIGGVVKAKTELIEKIKPNGQVILNGEDELLMKAAMQLRSDLMTFGYDKSHDVSATNLRNRGKKGISFDLNYMGDSWPVNLKVAGLQNVLNALAAASTAFCLGESPEHIVDGLGEFRGIKGRFELIGLPRGITLVDDTYNANPASLRAALVSLKGMLSKGDRIIVGLGEMKELGHETVDAHVEAGRMVAAVKPLLFIVMGDHAKEMLEGAISSGLDESRTETAKSHDEMASKIKTVLSSGDLVFLKGSRMMRLDRVVENLRQSEALSH